PSGEATPRHPGDSIATEQRICASQRWNEANRAAGSRTVARIDTVTTCFHHSDRETGRSCTRCGRPACPDCLREAPVGAHCFECVRAASPPARQRVRRWNATAGPLATKVLIGLNVVTYLATAAGGGAGGRGGDLQSRLSLYGPAVARGEWYRLISSGFVHYGLIHIGFNMLLLYQLGLMLEPALGRTRFLALYFAALLTGSFAALLLSPAVVSGGDSGDIRIGLEPAQCALVVLEVALEEIDRGSRRDRFPRRPELDVLGPDQTDEELRCRSLRVLLRAVLDRCDRVGGAMDEHHWD